MNAGDGESPGLPLEESTLLAGLGPAQVQEVAMSRAEYYRKEIRRMEGYVHNFLNIHNDAAPLHIALPPELLIHIFRHLHPTSLSDIQLTHVCRKWRTLIMKTPEFWVDMLSLDDIVRKMEGEDLKFVETMIHRSSPLPFTLSLRSDQLEFLCHNVENRSRLSSFSLWVNSEEEEEEEDFLILLTAEFPALEHLKIKRSSVYSLDDHFTSLELPLFQAMPLAHLFPRLRTLETSGIFFCPQLAVPTLTHLKISGSIRTLDIFVTSLKECHNLQSLELDTCSAILDIRTKPPADLPMLRKLYIEQKTDKWTHSMLQCLTVPATACISLMYNCASPRLITVVRRPLTRLMMHFTTPTTFKEQHEVVLQGSTADGATHMHLRLAGLLATNGGRRRDMDEVLDDLVWMVRPAETITWLGFALDPGLFLTVAEWEKLFAAFPGMRALTLRIDSCRNLFRALRNPNLKLDELEVICRNGMGVQEEIVTTIEARAERGQRLKFLFVENVVANGAWSRAREERLRAVVEEVHVGTRRPEDDRIVLPK